MSGDRANLRVQETGTEADVPSPIPCPWTHLQTAESYQNARADARTAVDLRSVRWRIDTPTHPAVAHAPAAIPFDLEETQPAALARLLAEHDLKPNMAVELVEQAAERRRDIPTEDALAWAYYRAGRLDEAAAAATRALRTGTRDRRVLYHAAAIQHALRDELSVAD